MPEITRQLELVDWLLPTEIQSEAIPLILGGGDIMMASETGTGKTGAFCIPIVQLIYEQNLKSEKNTKEKKDFKQSSNQHRTFWTLSPIDRASDLVLGKDLLTAQSKSGQWQGCRSNKGAKRKGKSESNPIIYYEVHFADQGLARVGWSLAGESLDLGTSRYGWGYGGTAKKSNQRQFIDYGQQFGEKFDIVGCILDLNSGAMSFTKNGRSMGEAFKLPQNLLESREIYPTICVKNAGCHIRFGPSGDNNDHKPVNSIWISELEKDQIVERSLSPIGINSNGPLSLIIEPSRELAKQTFDCIQSFSKNLGVRTSLLIGGNASESEKTVDKAHIVVCTPGKLSELINSDLIVLSNTHFFILDEADSLIQQGHKNLITSIHSRLPKMFESGKRLQTICCSATLHNFEVKRLSQQMMYFPMWIDLKGEDSIPETVHHVILRIDPRKDDTFRQLEGVLQTDGVHKVDRTDDALFRNSKPLSRPEEFSEAIKFMKFYYTMKAIESLNMDKGIIFCRTKLDCDNLEEFMTRMTKQTNSDRFSCTKLHSSLSQQIRMGNLYKFKDGQVKFLICTDVAARGIDIKNVPYVIQVSLPDEKSNYIHRIGRVGRSDRMGLALSFVGSMPEKVWFHKCRRKECNNTRLVEKGGCCIWFDELAMLGDIEDHLKCSIQEISRDLNLQVDEFDGKVVYGAKRLELTGTYEGHVEQLKSIVTSLQDLDQKMQENYLKLYMQNAIQLR